MSFDPEDLTKQISHLRRYARSLTRDPEKADDLVQSCLLRALRKRDRFESGSNLRAWLFTIQYRLFINGLRAAGREQTGFLPERPAPAGQESALELQRMESALHDLPSAQRATISLVVIEGCSYAEAGRIMDVPVGTVRSRLSRGRAALKRAFAGEDRRKILRRESILVVEDDYILAHGVGRMMEDMGYLVAGYADNAKDALRLANRTRPGFVLADLKLKDGWTGQRTARSIQKDWHSKVIYITAYCDRLAGDEAPYLAKPFTQQQLAGVVAGNLGRCA